MNSNFNYIFYSNQKDYNPADVLQKYLIKNKINFFTIETGNYIFNKINKSKFRIFFNNKIIKIKKFQINKFNNFFNIFVFNFYNLFFFLKNKNLFFKKELKNILIAQGMANLLISKFINYFFLNNKVKIIYFNGDIIPEKYSETNLNTGVSHAFFSFILFKINFFLRSYIVKTTKNLYYNNKVFKWDKKKFKKIYSHIKVPYLFDTNFFYTKKKFKKNNLEFVHLGNIEKSNGIFETLELIYKLKLQGLNSKLTIISAGSKSFFKDKDFKKYKNKINIRLFNFLEEDDLKKILRNSTFGMALYYFNDRKKKSNVMNGKVYFYLKNNLPVISTNYCSFAKDIKNGELGYCSNDMEQIVNYVLKMNNSNFIKIKKNIFYFMKKNNYHLKISKIIKQINNI